MKKIAVLLIITTMLSFAVTFAAANTEEYGMIYLSDYLRGEGKDRYEYHNIDEPALVFDAAYNKSKMNICGVEYEKGLGMHSSADNKTCLTVNIEGLGYSSFHAYVGMQNMDWAQEVERNMVSFFVIVDGIVVADSELMDYKQNAYHIAADIKGAKTLCLCLDYGSTPYSDYADWGGAMLSQEPYTKNVTEEVPPPGENAATTVIKSGSTSLSFAIDENRLYITDITNLNNGHKWLTEPAVYPLMRAVNGDSITWKYEKTDTSEQLIPTNDGDRLKKTVTVRFSSEKPKLSAAVEFSAWQGDCPIYFVSKIKNESDETVTFTEKNAISCSFTLKGEENSELWRFNRSRMGVEQDVYFNTGVLVDKCAGLYMSSSVVSSMAPSGILPFQEIQTPSGHGLYIGYDWSYGKMNFRALTDGVSYNIKNMLSNGSTAVLRKPGEVFEVPGAFVGAYTGDTDDGGNAMKNWFWDFEMTPSLRENANEPDLEFHIPAYSESEWKSWFRRNKDVAEWGVELLKMDYDWTLHSMAFGETAPADWEPLKTKWKNGMTWRKITDGYFPAAKLSLYMPDTYLRGNLSDTEAREKQIAAIKKRVSEWGINYWRSDFYVEGSNTYAEHEGLLYVLDTLMNDPELPQFRYEHCSSGGSLKDFTTLRRMTFMTTEDWARALQHRIAMYSNTYMINPAQLKADIALDWAPMENENEDLSTENWSYYNFRTGLMGAFMVCKHGQLTKTELRIAKETWSLYTTRQRDIIRNCDVYHILPIPDGENWDGLMYYNENLKAGSVLLFKPSAKAEDDKTIFLKGLKDKNTYSVEFVDHPENNAEYTGAQLKNEGLTVKGLIGDYASEVVFLTDITPDAAVETDTETQGEMQTHPTTDTQADTLPVDNEKGNATPIIIASVAAAVIAVGAVGFVLCKKKKS